MSRRAILAAVLMLAAVPHAGAATAIRFAACPQQVDGQTSDPPVVPVVVCQQLFPAAPFVHMPPDQRPASGPATLYGVVDLDPNVSFHIQNARFYDRNLTEYALVTADGKPIDETAAVMKANHLPSNRVHFLVYEAIGTITATKLQLTGLRPVILVAGAAIDGRFVGAWEGLVSRRRSETQWYMDPREPQNFAKIRINFAPPLTATNPIGELQPTPPLVDGKRFKATGRFENATAPVKLSTGECAPALNSFGPHNPFPDAVLPADYAITMWRFPAMHSLWSKDFHVVFDYPKGLNPNARAMASNHNFRLKDYIATSTHSEQLTFLLHGNTLNQIVFVLKPVTGGGGACK